MNMMAFTTTGRILTPSEIRQALIQLAKNSRRPEYSLIVQRDVVDAFRNGTYHPLKDAVIHTQMLITKEVNVSQTYLYSLRQFANAYSIRLLLAKVADVDPVYLTHIVAGTTELTEEIWQKLSAGIDQIKSNPGLYKDRTKYKQCGTYACYKVQKCRCALCCKAYQTYEAMRRAASAMA